MLLFTPYTFQTPAGIDYTVPAFIDSAGESRIYSIWDQSINPCASGDASNNTNGNECILPQYGKIPDNLGYGIEYTREDINRALASDNPWEIVPSRDYNGHGTFMSGVACGNLIEEKNFSGIAPLADICVVKCKEAKQSLKDFYKIDTNEPVYAENDIMAGVQYLLSKAIERFEPLIICIGMGTSMGDHGTGGILGQMLQNFGDYRGVAIVTTCGNEANTGHHYRSELIEAKADTEVELKVGGREGFMIELWSNAPRPFSVAIVSPSGEYGGKIQGRLGEKGRINFLLDETTVFIEYIIRPHQSGNECIQMRFQTPSEGIWKIRVFNESGAGAFFDMWLPIQNFLPTTTYFLNSDPDVTLCDPSNNLSLISNAYYDSENRSISINSSRGFTRSGNIKPDFAAPGIDVYGPLPRRGNVYPKGEDERMLTAEYGFMSGSSVATAVTAGTVALLMEWGYGVIIRLQYQEVDK